METELKVLTFNVTSLTTKLHVANEEIERLNADIDKIGTSDDPFWVAACEMKSQLTAAKEEIERLKLEVNGLMKLLKEVEPSEDVVDQLTAEREKVEKLRKAIADYVNNDIGRKDTLRNLEQTLADTV